MLIRFWIIVLLWWVTRPAGGAEFYAAPNGLPGSDGSRANPWSLQAALSPSAALVRPGDTIWLRGGAYSGPTNIWNASLNGASNAPIVVRQYPGERATIQGGLYVGGSWTWYWGFEITNPDSERNVTNNFARPEGIEIHGRGCKAINLIIHDTGHPGIGFWKQIGDGAEVNGCILWGIGMYDWSSGIMDIRGAGIYGQGGTADENRYIKDSIFFRNFNQGIHLYSTAAGVYVNGMYIEGNFFFNNGDASQNLFVGTVAQPCERISIINNCLYFDPGESGTGIRLGYGALNNTGLELKGNDVVGGSTSILINEWQGVTLSGNSMFGSKERLVQISRTGGFSAFDFLCSSNAYASAYPNPFLYSEAVGLISFARWQADTGYDINSSFSSALPVKNRIILRPNQFERGRAHIAVFNWELLPTVSVNISAAGLNLGDAFEVRDVQNYFGPPVIRGAYDGSPVVLPMDRTDVAALIGNVTHISNKHTGTDFGAFVVVPTGPASLPQNTPPALAPIPSQSVNEGSLLTFTATATDTATPPAALVFSLGPGAPAGAAITADGVFSWTPTEDQGPATNSIRIRVTDDGSPSLSATQAVIVVVKEVNSAPVLAPINDKVIVRGSQLTFTNSATDVDWPANKLTFSLGAGAPAGASVNATSGTFTWQPPSSQIPGTNLITLRVTDNGAPALFDARTFAVVVTDVNKAPVLAPISNRTNYQGNTFSFTASAIDTNQPAQTLAFSLDAPVPAGARVTPGGVFTWMPTPAQAPSTNRFTLRVTDSGTPSLSSTRAFTIVVLAVSHDTRIQLLAGGVISIRWVAVPNKTYQVQYKNSLQDPNWTNLGSSLKASSTSAAVTDNTSLRAQRFYRVVLVK